MTEPVAKLPEMVNILLVEDEPSHARLMEITLRHAGVSNNIIKIENGTEALEYLTGEGRYEGQDIPVIIVTSSDDPDEMERCYSLGCNGYLVKPPEGSALLEAFEMAGLY